MNDFKILKTRHKGKP